MPRSVSDHSNRAYISPPAEETGWRNPMEKTKTERGHVPTSITNEVCNALVTSMGDAVIASNGYSSKY